jgi:STIP1 family protein 1
MTDPVSTPDGITYDRKAIIKWLETRNYCPKTNKKLELKDLRPNYALKEAIHSMILKGGYSDSTVGKN